MKHKRVLLVVTKSNFGGAQRYVFEIASALKAQGVGVAVASGGQTGGLIDRLQGADIQHFSIKHFARDINVIKEWKASAELWEIIRTYKPDILHLNSSKAGGTGACVGRLLRVPHIIFTAHGWHFLEPRRTLVKAASWLLSFITGLLAHEVITVSDNDRSNAPSRLVKNKCTTIPTGVSNISFYTTEKAQSALKISPLPNTLQIVTVAELTTNKNLSFALRTIHEYNQSNTVIKYNYTIIGDGEQYEELEKQIQNTGSSLLHLAGSVTDARDYLQAFDAFLLPSLKEGLPYALLEAARAGLPLIASNRGGMPEVLRQGKRGILIDPQDPKTLISALDTLSKVQAREEYSQHSKHISEEYSLDRMIQQTTALYSKR